MTTVGPATFPYPRSAGSNTQPGTPVVWTSFFPMLLLICLVVALVVVPIIRYRRKNRTSPSHSPSVIIMEARKSDIEDEMDAKATARHMERTAYRVRASRKESIYDDRFGS